ncbi:MAG: hypothetical protein OHK0044_28790 [Burkholderiaceae bacterium]
MTTGAEALQRIAPVRVRDLPRFLAAIEPMASELAAGDITGALMRHADSLIEATAIGAGVQRAWLEEQTPDVLVQLAARVLEVNADFFVRSVLPIASEAAARIAQTVQTASGGTNGSPGSPAPASPTKT